MRAPPSPACRLALNSLQHKQRHPEMARILITSALPYINGIKHLGNLVGSQLPADLFARYNRGRGNEVMFICATDEHGTPAELAAAKAGQPVAEYCAELMTCRPILPDGLVFRSIISAAPPARKTTG